MTENTGADDPMQRHERLTEPAELLSKPGQPNLRVFDAALNDSQYREGHLPGGGVLRPRVAPPAGHWRNSAH
ncbi:MAG: hypothetical protein IT317_23790 [Anaerolineales bacterium]|nr:hypothetical protein [Anaerolineales bacterium]